MADGMILGGRYTGVRPDGQRVIVTMELPQRDAEAVGTALGWGPNEADPRTLNAGAVIVWRLTLPELAALMAQMEEAGRSAERAQLDNQPQLPLGSGR